MIITPKSIAGTFFETIAAKLDFSKTTSLLFEKIKRFNSKLKPITPKYLTRTYLNMRLIRFSLAGLPRVVIIDFHMSISQLFKELQRRNLEFKLITLKDVTKSFLKL